jgi:PAS domain S-box-containing protein
LGNKLFWAKFQYFGIVTIPLTWFIFAVHYMGAPGWFDRWFKYRIFLTIVPLLTLLLVWSNEYHGLVWRSVHLQAIGPMHMLGIEHGPWFWVYLAYGYVFMLLGSIRLVTGLLGSVRLHRWQITLALLAVLIPWIGNLVYITKLNPVEYLDWTPFSFTVAGLLFSISLFRFQLVNILPIAQQTVFAGLADCLLVLDLQDVIVDLNPAAREMIGNPAEEPIGKALAQVAPDIYQWVAQAGFDEAFRVEFSRGEGSHQRFHELRVAPLAGPFPRPIGRLVVCHEITPHKQEQARLERIVSERTEQLRQTVEQLQVELAQRSLAEKRFEDVVESAPDAMLLLDQTGGIVLVNAQAERLFGYARDELLGQNVENLIPVHRRGKYPDYLRQFVANPWIRQTSFRLNLSGLRKDGSEFPAEVSLGPLKTADSYWVACNVHDITERKQAEEEQNRLLEEIKQSREQLSALTIRLQEVQEIERHQIASQLHDRIGQNLTGLNLNLQLIGNQLSPESSQAVGNRLSDSLKLVEETTRQVRNVMLDLHPPVLDEYGLVSALYWYCANFSQRTGIAARVVGEEFEPRLPRDDELVLFRLVQEALNNVAKHARATQVEIVVESSEGAACLIIQDDGQGFDPQALNAPTDQPHWGLINMQQRAVSIGAQLAVDSAPGQGTQVSVVLRRSQDED